jgi:hypothetical protein
MQYIPNHIKNGDEFKAELNYCANYAAVNIKEFCVLIDYFVGCVCDITATTTHWAVYFKLLHFISFNLCNSFISVAAVIYIII